MSPITKKFFVASLIYFILGLLSQAVATFDVWLGFNPLAYTAVTATEQLLLIGWLTQLGLALVYDRWLSETSTLGVGVFVLFNLGLPLTIMGQPGIALFGGNLLGAAAAFGGLLQLFAGFLFVRDAWSLIRSKA